MKHFLALEGFGLADSRDILERAAAFKRDRDTRTGHAKPLSGQTWALIFTKSSTRTRVSFEVGIRELGGESLFLSSNDIQLGRGEPIRDTARVLGRMTHGAVIRTFAQSDVAEFASFGKIPTVNALTDEEHPCQVLTDVFTFEEKRGSIAGKKVAFIGDAACNMGRSWAYAAGIFGFDIVFAAPKGYECPVSGPNVFQTTSCAEAAAGADLLYTDVWVSMGKEAESAQRLADMAPYQINAALLARAKPDALVLHCLPAYRGKEITEEVMEARAQDIFDQAENRLHVQKGVLDWLVG
ncbi:ornithine carbamoyltransferase [Verrucomicrobium sp. GAS474]|uniref:ornithine carbamoyltransferase n=1 Tax=Verrucomicrobium sp. GAS474 TaxID=1882831 RepID=UPI0008794733|nr:ornithine carbamoyltransferase [Verrucomicrobium sp. GAS474]SDU03526.1 ornithine carbamoyltransferase [Verrucomicrobium sp. GAS474]